MEIELVRATVDDAAEIHRIQVSAFAEIYERYQDHDSNPANKTIEQVAARIAEPDMECYFFRSGGENIGSVRVIPMPENECHLSSICIVPQWRGRGLGLLAMAETEALYPDAVKWSLRTIKQEAPLCRFYERLGYVRTDMPEKVLQEGMSLVGYEKVL